MGLNAIALENTVWKKMCVKGWTISIMITPSREMGVCPPLSCHITEISCIKGALLGSFGSSLDSAAHLANFFKSVSPDVPIDEMASALFKALEKQWVPWDGHVHRAVCLRPTQSQGQHCWRRLILSLGEKLIIMMESYHFTWWLIWSIIIGVIEKSEWGEKILANHTSDKELRFKIHRGLVAQ